MRRLTQALKASVKPMRRLNRRLVNLRLGRAVAGCLSLWAGACGQDVHPQARMPVAHVPKKDGLDRTRLALQPELTPVTHVIVVGDSISEGMGAQSKSLSYAALLYRNDDRYYPEDHGQDLVHLLGPRLSYRNVAHSGDTSQNVVEEQLPELERQLQKDAEAHVAGMRLNDGRWQITGRTVVVMTVGGNDMQSALRPNPSFTGPVLTRSLINLNTILSFFGDNDRFVGGTSRYVGNVYDITDGEDQAHGCNRGFAFPGMSRALDVWSQSFAVLAEQNDATLVDILGLFRGHGFNFHNPRNPYFDRRDTTLWLYDRDCMHPNNRGHDMLRHAFLQHIAQDHGDIDISASILKQAGHASMAP